MTNPDTPDQVKVEQLLPCPFCGGQAELIHEPSQNCMTREYWEGFCPKCDFGAQDRTSPDKAIAAWNTRASLTPPANSTGLLRKLRPYVEAAHAGIDTAEERNALRREIDTHLANQSDSTGEKAREALDPAAHATMCEAIRNGDLGEADRIIESLSTPAPVAGSPVDGVREALAVPADTGYSSSADNFIIAALLAVRRANAGSFARSANEFEAYDTAVLDCVKAVTEAMRARLAEIDKLLSTPATPTAPVDEGLVNRVKDELRGEPGEEYTDAGMEEAFFRWPIVEKAILSALSRRTTAESLIAGLRNYAREELGLISHSKAHRLVTDAADAIEEISATRLAALKDQG